MSSEAYYALLSSAGLGPASARASALDRCATFRLGVVAGDEKQQRACRALGVDKFEDDFT
jgi:hypothetical protein